MAPAPRFSCPLCKRQFVKDFLVKDQGEYICCLFCEVLSKASAKIDKLGTVLDSLQTRVGEMDSAAQDASVVLGKEADVIQKVDKLDNRIGRIENKLADSDGFQTVKRGGKVEAGNNNSSIVTRNRFHVLEDEVRDEPSLILVGDSLIRHQDEEFCRKGPRRKHVCYPGKKIEDITEKIEDLVVNSSEETVFVYLVGTNNIASGRSEEVVSKYKTMITKLRNSRKRSVVCGLIPRYDVDSLVLSRMLGINTRVEDLCRREGVMYVNVWDHFSRDRSLYGKDGLHLNRVGKARLGRVLDEGVRKELERNRMQVQGGEIPPGQAGRDQSSEVVVGRLDEVVGGAREVRSAGAQIGDVESIATSSMPLNA